MREDYNRGDILFNTILKIEGVNTIKLITREIVFSKCYFYTAVMYMRSERLHTQIGVGEACSQPVERQKVQGVMSISVSISLTELFMELA